MSAEALGRDLLAEVKEEGLDEVCRKTLSYDWIPLHEHGLYMLTSFYS